jgi:hypothetical protein
MGLLSLLEQIIERRPGVGGISWLDDLGGRSGHLRGVDAVAGYGNAGFEEFAGIHSVLGGYAQGDGLQALEAGGRLKVAALFAAVQSRVALGTRAG